MIISSYLTSFNILSVVQNDRSREFRVVSKPVLQTFVCRWCCW